MTVVHMPVSELVEDFDIYPRHEVSSVNVRNLISAYLSGRTIDPIKADKKTKRIIDGFHRRRMWIKVAGADAIIPVDVKDYKSDEEMLAAAVEANAHHGLQLQEVDKRRVVLRLGDLGVDDERIATVLHIPPARVQKLRVRIATVTEPGGTIRKEPLKRPHFHMQGKPMSEGQAQAARSAPGTSYSLVVRQLRDAINWRLLDPDDEKLTSALHSLHGELTAYLDLA